MSEPVPFTLDGRALTAERGELLIAAAERHGVYIPRFCHHPRMKPVGMCRMCLVEVDGGRGPALQPSCMLEVTPEMTVLTASDATVKAQDGVLEFLLINHPLDCPVCDKGGECPLQDQTMAYGPGESRFVEEKRHFEKPIPISDLVHLDRERCILCDRCTRFAKDVAGDALIHFQDRGNQTQVNTFPDHPFASYFSGNTVQICPVGALTASAYRFKARPWDLTEGESTCQTCSVGCRITVQTSRDKVLRYQGVDVDPVNWGWLCDKGRFGFEAIDHVDRLTAPLVRGDDEFLETSWADALQRAAMAIKGAVGRSGPGAVGVIGGSRLTNEDAYAWAKLAKGVIGTDNVDCQLGDGLPAELVLGVPRATIDEVCAPGGTVLLLAPDLKEELPVLHLRLRHAAVEDGVTVVEVAPTRSSLTPHAAISLRPLPGEVHGVVEAIAGGADGTDVGGVGANDLARAAALLAVAKGPVKVVLGRQSLAEGPGPTVDAVAALLEGLGDVVFLSALRRSNVHGALDMGLAPGILPGRVSLDAGRGWYADRWATVPDARGLDTMAMLEAAADGRVETLVVLGADVFDVPDQALARRALDQATVIVVDLLPGPTLGLADIILPAAGFAECDGTTTNIEGRVSPVSRQVSPPGTARSDWMVAAGLAEALGADLGLDSVAAVWAEIERVAPAHAGLTSLALRSPLATGGVVVPVTDVEALLAPLTTPVTVASMAVHGRSGVAAGEYPGTDRADGDEAPARDDRPATLRFEPPARTVPPAPDSYSLRLIATRRLYDEGTMVAHAASLAGLAAGTGIRINPYDFDRLGVTDGATVRVSSAAGELVARVAEDSGVPRGAAAMVVKQPDVAALDLIDGSAVVTDVRVETAEVGG